MISATLLAIVFVPVFFVVVVSLVERSRRGRVQSDRPQVRDGAP